MKKWLKTVLIITIIAVFVIGGTIGFRAYKTNKELKEKYDVVPSVSSVGINDMGLYISASGNIVSSEEISVKSASYGEVAAQNVEVGQKVTAGQVLAEIDGETLNDDIKTLEDEIFAKEVEIEKSSFPDDIYYVKSPIDGEVKDLKVSEDDEDTEDIDEASDISEVIEKYGYLCLVSSQDLMYVITDETADFLTVGTEVKVSRYDYEYDGTVEKIEDGKTYILVNSDNISMGGRVNIYLEGSNKKVQGIAELYDWVEIGVPTQEGKIVSLYTYNNESVEVGEVLFTVRTRSQEMVDAYNELADLKDQLAQKLEMLEKLDIVSPVDGIITEVAIGAGDTVAEDQQSYTIADTSVWVVQVNVDELDINQIELGMPAQVTVDAYDEAAFEGQVSAISSVGTASNGVTSYEVYVEVENNDVFKLNMTANAEIEVDFISDAVTVPVEAVREVNGKSFVVVYLDPSEEEVQALKEQMIEAEKNVQDTVSDISSMSQEELASLREQAQAARASGEMPEGGFAGRGSGLYSEDDMPEGLALVSMTSQLSIADRLYGQAVEVEVGLINETYAQILSGLSQGDRVIIPDSDAAASSSDVFGTGGGMGGFGGAFR